MNWERVEELVRERYITKQVHPTLPLHIFNYTPKTQYERYWCEETEVCRGLVADNSGNVVARPFRKFRNLVEHEGPLPDGEPEVHDKLDGSLFILACLPDHGVITATRGSFGSPQAAYGRELLARAYSDARFEPGWTYLFELIYPENRIVVDYGDTCSLTLLAKIRTADGVEADIADVSEWPGAVATRYPFAAWEELKHDPAFCDNREGVVLFWREAGLWLKVKHEEYVRLHRIVTGVTARHIWEELSAGRSLDALLDRVPDEFYRFVRDTEGELRAKHRTIMERCLADFDACRVADTRKGFADLATRLPYPAVLFALLDGKDATSIVWKLVKPEGGINPFAARAEG